MSPRVNEYYIIEHSGVYVLQITKVDSLEPKNRIWYGKIVKIIRPSNNKFSTKKLGNKVLQYIIHFDDQIAHKDEHIKLTKITKDQDPEYFLWNNTD